MRLLIAFLFLLPVAVIKVVLIVAGLVIVPLRFPDLPRLYRIGKGRPVTKWEAAIRNPVGGFGFLLDHPDTFTTYGEVLEAPETTKRLQWRVRHHRWLASIRLLWQYSSTRYGELYFGWKLGSAPPEMDFAMSLRPWATTGK